MHPWHSWYILCISACMSNPSLHQKTVLNAVHGYHSVALYEESRKLTTFITKLSIQTTDSRSYLSWRCLHISIWWPYLGGKDKVKCVDDTCLFKFTIEEGFFNCWDYLTLFAKNGIVINEEKYQFCSDYITFAGLNITPTGIQRWTSSSNQKISTTTWYYLGLFLVWPHQPSLVGLFD